MSAAEFDQIYRIAKKVFKPILSMQPGIVDISRKTLEQGIKSAGGDLPSDWDNVFRRFDRTLAKMLPVVKTQEQAFEAIRKQKTVYYKRGKEKAIIAKTFNHAEGLLTQASRAKSLENTVFAEGFFSGTDSEAMGLAMSEAAAQMTAKNTNILKTPRLSDIQKALKNANIGVTKRLQVKEGKNLISSAAKSNFIITVPNFGNSSITRFNDVLSDRVIGQLVDNLVNEMAPRDRLMGDLDNILKDYYGTGNKGPKRPKKKVRSSNKSSKYKRKIKGKGANSGVGSIRERQGGMFTSLTKLIKEANKGALVKFMREKMGKGNAKHVLNWRTGRLARSMRIDNAEAKKGKNGLFISNLKVSYMFAPYDTFDNIHGIGKQYKATRETPSVTGRKAALEFFRSRIKGLK